MLWAISLLMCSSPPQKTVVYLLAIMSYHNVWKKSSIYTVTLATTLLHCPTHMDIVAINKCLLADELQGDCQPSL